MADSKSGTGTITKYEYIDRTFNNEKTKKVNYVFHIELSNGDKAECASLKESGSYSIGDNISYDIKPTKSGFWISGIKMLDKEGKPTTSNYNNPSEIAGTAFSLSLVLASTFFDMRKITHPNDKVPGQKEGALEAVAYKFYEWIMKGQDIPNRDLMFQKRNTMEACIKMLPFWFEVGTIPATVQVISWSESSFDKVTLAKSENAAKH